LKQVLPKLRVVARALPSDKSRLIKVSQEIGLVAGMTGDGVNDAPALKKADVGFSMGSGTEIAKEASDIVILDDNFLSIAKAILYGRTIFKSIRKFIIFQVTVNLCAVVVSIVGPFLGVATPITVLQMLWINMVMDTLAGLAFSGEVPLEEYMNEPPKRRDTPIINPYMWNQILFTGIYTASLCLVFLKLPIFSQMFRGAEGKHYLMTAFFGLFIFASVFNSFNARTYRLNLLAHIWKNKSFMVIISFVFVVQLLLIYFGGTLFRTTGLNLFELQIVLLLAFSVVPVDLSRKVFIRLNGRKGSI
jgi:magnesium-transporting ATPase (P-type)